MNPHDPKRLSRRQLLRVIGASGLAATVAGTGVAAPNLVQAAAAAQTDTPEGFLAHAYAQRAQAMTTRDLKVLDLLYDTASPRLLAFEKDRAAFMNDLGSRWNGTILSYTASASLIDLQASGSTVTARIYETVRMIWIPHPVEIPAAILRDRQKEQDQSRYTFRLPHGARGEITSLLGNRHEVTLEKGQSGWRVVKDAYEEPDLYGASPDLAPGSWAAVWLGTLPNGSLQIPPPPQSSGESALRPTTTTAYNRSAAVSYATSHCLSSSYNPNYCNFNGAYCGGDCANFVSQCFYAGGQTKDSSWKTYSGKCGSPSCTAGNSSNAGTDTWANNKQLRNWFISNRGAVAQPSIYYLGAGDIVNYITGSNTDWNHVTIVVQAQGGPNGALICSHNPDRCSTSWSLSDFSPKNYSYTQIN